MSKVKRYICKYFPLLKYKLFVITFLFISSTAFAFPLDIRIDLGSFDQNNGNWNYVKNNSSNIYTGNLVDYNTGLTTGITYNLSGITGGSTASDWSEGVTIDWVVWGASRDSMLSSVNSDVSWTFDNLNETSYNLEVVFSAKFPDGGRIRIDRNNASRTYQSNPVPDIWDSSINGKDDWLIWDNIVPQGGILTINFLLAGNFSYVGASAIRLTEASTIVPEPTTIALLGISLAGFAGTAIRRKLKKAKQ